MKLYWPSLTDNCNQGLYYKFRETESEYLLFRKLRRLEQGCRLCNIIVSVNVPIFIIVTIREFACVWQLNTEVKYYVQLTVK